LKKMVTTGAFREDLFYRLYVVPIFMPPLRERKEDIPLMVEYFIKKFADKCGRPKPGLGPETMKCLLDYDWPGNIRELENTIERVVVSLEGPDVSPADLPEHVGRQSGTDGAPPSPRTIEELKQRTREIRQKAVEDVEREFVVRALAENNGSVAQAARAVGMQRTNFYRLINKYGIKTIRDTDPSDDVDDSEDHS
jgi:DNA-binding NtrC family response regulator